MDQSRTKIRFYIYISALLPLIILAVTGVVLLKYHSGAPAESTVMGVDSVVWQSVHNICAVAVALLVILHLFIKTDWVKRFFTSRIKGAFKVSNAILFVVFFLCVITAIASVLITNEIGGIHNKLGLILIMFFILHLWNYRKIIINHFK